MNCKKGGVGALSSHRAEPHHAMSEKRREGQAGGTRSKKGQAGGTRSKKPEPIAEQFRGKKKPATAGHIPMGKREGRVS